jgi:hypothetical protein
VGGVGGSFQAQRIKGRSDHGIGIGIGIGINLGVYVKPLKVLRFGRLLQGMGGKVREMRNLMSL